MVHSITLLLLSANFLAAQCQEDVDTPDFLIEQQTSPSYSYGYGVQDAKTGDLKTAWEEKEGDTVKGHYSVLEPDGSVRSVQYKADAKSGFNAVVKTEKLNDVPMGTLDSARASQMQSPGHYSVMESDGSIKTMLYKTDPNSSNKDRPNDIPMDALDVWHLDGGSRMQHPGKLGSVRLMQYKADAKAKNHELSHNLESMESFHLDNAPRMQDKSLRDYGKLEPAFDFPAFSSVGENEGKQFDQQKEIPQLWSYRDYLKKLSDEADKIRKYTKRGSLKNNKYPTSLVEFDLSHGKYPDKLPVKETSFGEPIPSDTFEKYLAAQSNDFKKYMSPFANSPFRLPNLFGGDFSGLKALTDKYKPKPEPFSDLHEYVSASEIAHSFPDFDSLKKKKPYFKNKYPGILPLPYSGAASSLEDDFIIIPKKKYLENSKLIEPGFDSYAQHLDHNIKNIDDEYEPHHVHDDKCNHNKDKNKDVLVRKYIKKSKKPVINLLDIFDI